MKNALFIFLVFIFYFCGKVSSQSKDSIFYMNGTIITAEVTDTLLGAVSYKDPADTSKKVHIENDAIFAVKFADGPLKYYYTQDTIQNWFTRDEMWMFMLGERDARKGYKSPGAFWGGVATGITGGITGTLWAPAVPFAFMGSTELFKIKIRHKTISNPYALEHDAYILGYQREAIYKRRITVLKGGGVGLAIGFTTFLLYFNNNNRWIWLK